MANYFDCAALMGQLTSAEMQRKLKQASGAEAYNEFLLLLNGAPVADVAPVVHCKDCAHRTEMGNCGHPRHHGILPSAYPYDFCSYGARMDDDESEAR